VNEMVQYYRNIFSIDEFKMNYIYRKIILPPRWVFLSCVPLESLAPESAPGFVFMHDFAKSIIAPADDVSANTRTKEFTIRHSTSIENGLLVQKLL
jgi:hypothetical protein